MKKLVNIISALLLIVSASAMAKPSENAQTMIKLYSQPKTSSKVITQINANDRLVPIYRDSNANGWVKVGDHSNGQVGWINEQDYHAARQAAIQAATQVTLYAKPNSHSPAIGSISTHTPIVTIVSSKNQQWVKVGDHSNGQVGWININDYRHARWASQHQQRSGTNRPPHQPLTTSTNDANSIYITVNNKNGQQQITAYKNGKKLNQEQAKRLWQRMQQRQQQMMAQDANIEHAAQQDIDNMMQQFQQN